MKKNKKTNTALWDKWTQSPELRNKFIIFVILFVLFILSLVILWKRYSERGPSHAVSLIQATPTSPPVQPVEKSIEPSQAGLTLLSNRIEALEKRMNQQQETLLTPPKLVAVELVRAVLDGLIPLDTLTTFLQKKPDPWAEGILMTLRPLKQSLTYPQLKESLNLSYATTSTIWARIKKKIKSIIRIRKLNKKGEYEVADVEDVQCALKAHDIQKALKNYEKLPPEEKAQLSAWKELAESRLTLELALKKLILELAGE